MIVWFLTISIWTKSIKKISRKEEEEEEVLVNKEGCYEAFKTVVDGYQSTDPDPESNPDSDPNPGSNPEPESGAEPAPESEAEQTQESEPESESESESEAEAGERKAIKLSVLLRKKNKRTGTKNTTFKGKMKQNKVNRMKRPLNQIRKSKAKSVTADQFATFVDKCPATVANEACSNLISKIYANTATEAEIANFPIACKVDDPNGGGGNTSGSILVSKVSLFLIFLVLTIANFHFGE
jgi:hypothetical protein